MEAERLAEVQGALTGWAVEALGRWTRAVPDSWPARAAGDWLANYGRLLSPEWRLDGMGGDRLQSIFSLVRPPGGAPVEPFYTPARPLSLETVLPDDEPVSRQALWEAFAGEFPRLPAGARRFESFACLFQKYAWAVPCTTSEAGVSLYEEFKALAALVHASAGAPQPADRFLLVGGDLPGIQRFVYTITSKGAAKGLRGRSFFLQLLGDAIVRRLVADLGLCSLNVIYGAGGNFMLLAPAAEQTLTAAQALRRRVNQALLAAVQGDLALVLETVEAEAASLFAPDRFRETREALGGRVALAKNRLLAELAADWDAVFAPVGSGSDQSCAVCRVEIDERISKPLERTSEPAGETEPSRVCYLCDSFRELAEGIRFPELWMTVSAVPANLCTPVDRKDGWDDLLARMTGLGYRFTNRQPGKQGTVLTLNRTDFLAQNAHGFRLAANVTPQVRREDRDYLIEEQGIDPDEAPKLEDIRSFELMAHAAETAGAIERVGVLRMDVDNLGWVFSDGLPELTMPRLSGLSGAMDLFFSGYLNRLVRQIGGNDLYVIYAGGDDLFVVGAWNHLPALAEAIREGFRSYVHNHPTLTLSGGLTLEGVRFPLYRAAERAGEAEARAKRYVRPIQRDEAKKERRAAPRAGVQKDVTRSDGGATRGKDAFCFLGQVVGWEPGEWDTVRDEKARLLWLAGLDAENLGRPERERQRRLPRAILQVVQNLHQLYRTGLRDARRKARRAGHPLPDPRMVLGRWTWMQAYSLTRMSRRSGDRAIVQRVKELQRAILRPETVHLSGLAARWAEYLTRKPRQFDN